MLKPKTVLTLAAVLEIATGAALLIAPAVMGRLLFGEDLAGVSLVVARLAGVALISLGITCWPGTPWTGMLAYNVMVAAFLAWIGLTGHMRGVLLWPAVGAHVVLTTLLIRGAANRTTS
jgi:hypothetical protein